MVKPLKSPWKPPPIGETRGSIDLIFTLPKPLKKFHASVLARDWGSPRIQKYPKSKVLVWRQLRELTNYSSYSSWLTLSNSILCFDLLPFLKHLLLKHKARSLIILILFDCCLLQALEHYTDIFDIKRAIVHTHLLNPEVARSIQEILTVLFLSSV